MNLIGEKVVHKLTKFGIGTIVDQSYRDVKVQFEIGGGI